MPPALAIIRKARPGLPRDLAIIAWAQRLAAKPGTYTTRTVCDEPTPVVVQTRTANRARRSVR